MVVALDDGVGRVLQTLQTNNILDDTLIFFLSDNGAPYEAATSGKISNNYPLRGYKMDVLEGHPCPSRGAMDTTVARASCSRRPGLAFGYCCHC
jgi:arylsulfatase A-like enzyme